MKKENFTTWDVMRLLDLKRGRLREWIERGYVRPSVEQADGVGTKNVFSRLDVISIGAFDLLLGSGLNRHAAANVVKLLSDQVQAELKKRTGYDIEESASTLIVTRRRERSKGKQAYSATIHFEGEDLGRRIPYIKEWELIQKLFINEKDYG